MDIDAILAEAKKKSLSQKDQETRRQFLVSDLAQREEEKKEAEAQEWALQGSKQDSQRKLGELRGLRSFIDQSKFKDAEAELIQDINALEVKLGEKKSLICSLSKKICALSAEISSMKRPKTSDPSACYMESLVANARVEIRDAYEQVKGLKELLASCGDNKRLINCHCKIVAGGLRALQDGIRPTPSPAEQILLRKCFGMIASLTKLHMCGIVKALYRDRKEDWNQYVQDAREEVEDILSHT